MKRFAIAVLVLSFAALAGCDSGPAPRAAAVKPAAKKTAAATTASAAGSEIQTTVPYSYNPVSKRDPFRSPDEIRASRTVAGLEGGCAEPLCQWDLEQLTLVAVVTGDANAIAMLEDPQGRGYIVHRASRVGKLGGKVTNILRDSIVVTEYWTQPNGESKPIQKPLQIKEDKGFVPAMDLVTGKTYE